MTTFFLVRHGLTAHTGQRLTGRSPGVPLSEEGLRQVKATAAALAQQRIRALYSSPIERTMQTAEVVSERLRLPVEVDDRIIEVGFGSWSNRSFKQLRRTRMWQVVQRFPSAARFPQGETLRAVQARAVDALEDLRRRHPRSAVCCVSHADVIRLAVAHYAGVHIDHFQRIEVSPASVTVLRVSDAGPRVLAVNVRPDLSPGVVEDG